MSNVDFYVLSSEGYLLYEGSCDETLVGRQLLAGETVHLGKPSSDLLPTPISAELTELFRKKEVQAKAERAIDTLRLAETKLDLLADGLVDLSKVLVSKGLLDLAEVPPKVKKIAKHWDDHVNPILAARDAAIANGTLPDDFNP